MRRVVRVARLARAKIGEFGGDRLAEDDGAGIARQRDAGRIGGRAEAAICREP